MVEEEQVDAASAGAARYSEVSLGSWAPVDQRRHGTGGKCASSTLRRRDIERAKMRNLEAEAMYDGRALIFDLRWPHTWLSSQVLEHPLISP